MQSAFSRLEGVLSTKISGKTATVTYDKSVTDPKKIVEQFNKAGGRYKASKP